MRKRIQMYQHAGECNAYLLIMVAGWLHKSPSYRLLFLSLLTIDWPIIKLPSSWCRLVGPPFFLSSFEIHRWFLTPFSDTFQQGGYTCGDCAPGYTGDPYRSCYYLSYCDPSDPRSNPCHQFAKCIRLDSGRSFKCEVRENIEMTYRVLSLLTRKNPSFPYKEW